MSRYLNPMEGRAEGESIGTEIGMSTEVICEYTGLSKEQIEHLNKK